jgi:hypothetical protein
MGVIQPLEESILKQTIANPGKSLISAQHIRSTLIASLTLATLVSGSDAFACASCGCTLSTDWGSQGVSTKEGYSADISETYINQNQLIYGNSKPSAAQVQALYAAGEEVETATLTQTTTVSIAYNGEKGGISLQVPYVHRTHGTEGQTANVGVGDDYGAGYSESGAAGLGDIRLIGNYNGFSSDKTTGLILGIKISSGDTNAKFSSGAAAGNSLDPGLQIGTGSTDYILGAYTSGTFSTYGWFVQGTVQHAMTGLVTVAGTAYRPGDAYLLNSGIRYAGFGSTVSPMLQLNLVHREYDQGPNGGVGNDVFTGSPISGGNLAYLSPGLSVRLGGGTSVYGFVQLPIYQNVGSLQLVPQYIASVGVHQNF